MKRIYTYLSVAVLASASLSSCSRSNYVFKPSNSAYGVINTSQTEESKETNLGLEQVQPVAQAPAEIVSASTKTTEVVTRSAVAVAEARTATAKAVAAKAESVAKPSKEELKSIQQAVKAAKKDVKGVAADGKSQTTALLLNIFLGGFGVHRFYLGYTGRGFLYIGLLLTSFLILPAIALFVLLIIDLINIITGKLKPRDGEYAKKFN